MITIAPPTTQIYRVFIKATPEAIWTAITSAEFTSRYFHGANIESTWEPGTPYRGLSPDRSQIWVEGSVHEVDPPRRLVHGWRALYNPECADEPESRVTWEIEPREGGVCLLTTTHDRLEQSPKTAAGVSGEGWTHVLSGLKTLLETGEPLFA